MSADPEPHNNATREEPFPIVGVGASAGGLEAFTALLADIPPDTGMALVLVQHLDPVHESILPRLLARVTALPTHEVVDDMRVAPNSVYVIPPNVGMQISGGVLKLTPRPEGRQPQHAIDMFFESLAVDRSSRAIGVVLSGAASDGTLGLEAIKAEGGITFAQDESARYDSMPRSAIAAGCVDFVMSPAAIAEELVRIASHPFIYSGSESTHPAGASGVPVEATGAIREDLAPDDPNTPHRVHDRGFRKIVALLNHRTGVDFTLYKSTTIQRRIARRMVLTKHLNFADYAAPARRSGRARPPVFGRADQRHGLLPKP